MSIKTLYVSDLDGTLLNREPALSDFTVNTINSLVSKGMIFSYATARSYFTAGKLTRKISPQIPVIVYNGAFILGDAGQTKLLANYFSPDSAERILSTLLKCGVCPIVYAYINGSEKFSYCRSHMTQSAIDFVTSRERSGDDPRSNPVSLPRLGEGDIFYFTCIDTTEKLKPLYDLFAPEFECVYQKDIYDGSQWLEIMPSAASKAKAITELKRLLGCERIVCFGDGKNDLPMFRIADECYAVENAHSSLKEISTAVIGSNNEDAVAKWLLDNVRL